MKTKSTLSRANKASALLQRSATTSQPVLTLQFNLPRSGPVTSAEHSVHPGGPAVSVVGLGHGHPGQQSDGQQQRQQQGSDEERPLQPGAARRPGRLLCHGGHHRCRHPTRCWTTKPEGDSVNWMSTKNRGTNWDKLNTGYEGWQTSIYSTKQRRKDTEISSLL